jgi:hypothetical protein
LTACRRKGEFSVSYLTGRKSLFANLCKIVTFGSVATVAELLCQSPRKKVLFGQACYGWFCAEAR